MGANGDCSVDSLNMIESMLDFSNATWMLLAASNLSAFIAKLTALGKVALGLGFVIFIHELGHFDDLRSHEPLAVQSPDKRASRDGW